MTDEERHELEVLRRGAIAKLLRDTAYSKNGWLNFYETADAIFTALAEERDVCKRAHERDIAEVRRVNILLAEERAELNALRGFYQALDCGRWGRLNRAHFDALAAEWGVPRLAKPPESHND